MNATSQNEYGRIKTLLINHPREAFGTVDNIRKQWQKLNYIGAPQFDKAIHEYDRFVEAISQENPTADLLKLGGSTGLDSLYVRDASIVTDEGVILCNMGKAARMDEPDLHHKIFLENEINVLGKIQNPGLVEGGDVAWLHPNLLVIGLGYRTNAEGIRQVRNLIDDSIEIVTVHLPHYKGPSDVFHLMSIISPVDKDLAVVYSPLMPVTFRERLISEGYRLVEVPAEEFESIGCNVLAIAPRKCLMLSGNPITKRRLEEAGASVIEYEGNEISLKGCGGPTCLTRPILREL